MTTPITFQFSLLSALLSILVLGVAGIIPSTCKHYECPSYDLIQVGNGYEIRRYDSTVWASTIPIQDNSLLKATKTGYLSLVDYIQGRNNYKQTIERTAPVVTKISSNNTFVVSFYLPKKNQENPPRAYGLYVERRKSLYVAVRQFGGFVSDSNVGQEANALKASMAGSKWSATIPKSYTLAQYNAPFQKFDRVNEIWFLLNVETSLP